MSKGIRAMQATGGESALLSKARVTTAPLGGLCWSPDGAWIAFTDGRGGRSRAGTLRRVEASGGGRSMDMIVGVSNAIDAGCTWSPDGRWIAYLGEGGVHVVSPEGKDDHIVIPTIHRASLRFNKRGELAAILPGQSDVFETYDLSGRLISSVPLDLAPQIGVSHFCFTPDGRRMAVTIYDLKYDIWMIEGFARPTTGLMRFFRHWTIP